MKNKKNGGFTLLELLVVIVIISIASTILILNLGGSFLSNKSSEFFAEQMMSLIKLARQQAIFETEVVGIRIADGKYSFLILDDTAQHQTWHAFNDKDPFWAPHAIPNNLSVSFNNNDTQNENMPQIIIQPSGELSPFQMNIHGIGTTKTYTIQGQEAGQLELKK